VALGPRAVERAREGGGLRAYFDLRPYLEGDLPYTPAVSLWYALDAALAQLEEEGQDRRLARHLLLRDMVRAGARALGLSPLAADPVASPTVTALVTPPGVSPDALRREALGLGVRLAGGLGPLRERVVRVGHVGAVAPADIPGALAALEVAWARLTGGGATGQAAAQAVTTWYAHVRFPSTQEVSP
jgi:alanine-glyoxylate transaminase/serine-glyoxylate transaminase/serine-pyruvate transaminase